MTDRVHARLLILAVLVMSLVATLAAKAFSLQLLGSQDARGAAAGNVQRELVIPAARGLILDQQGRALATNRIGLDVLVDRGQLRRLDDDGDAVVAALAQLLALKPKIVSARLQNCGTPGASRQPNCWNGAPGAAPVVASDVGIEIAGQIMANPTGFPAVAVRREPVRDYPGNTLATHSLGHVGAVRAEDLAENPDLAGVPVLGRAGLERQYDQQLRGSPGREQVTVDSAGNRTSSGVALPATPGQTLVTNLDSQLQAVVEKQLQAAINRARSSQERDTGLPYEADGGAAAVLDVRTGAVLALASAPDFDANLWVGGISARDWATLTDPEANDPLLNRAVQAPTAPASTFKAISALAALATGYSTSATYECPALYRVGKRKFTNYQDQQFGDITLRRALEVSCDTVFYRLAHEQWMADGGSFPVADPIDAISATAADFGFGLRTGIDLPGEAAGGLASRQSKQAQWDEQHEQWCRRAASGYPELTDRARARYLKKVATDNCNDGMRWRAGDALNAAIGQGDTSATVLQVASAYAAIANGGTVYRPQLARALLDADGSVAQEFGAERVREVDAPAQHLRFLRRALRGVVGSGTAQAAFEGFPLDEIPVAAKTGTAEVFGRQTTSWFASFAPAEDPRYVVVMMVSQGGTGSGAAGPSVKAIYDALFGVRNGKPSPGRSVLVGGDVAAALPTIGASGVPVAPGSTLPPAQ